MLHAERLTLTYQDGESTLNAVNDVSILIAVTHNPEILTEADLVVTLRDGRIAKVQDRMTRTMQVAPA